MARFQDVAFFVLVLGCNGGASNPPQAEQAAPLDQAAQTAAAEPAPAPEPVKPMPFMIVEDAKVPVVRTPDACVAVELDRASHSLRYRRGASASCATFETSQDLLHQMLLAFAASGELQGVTSFEIGRDYEQFYLRLALAASRSPAWDAKLGKARAGHSNDFVVTIAHDATTFYPEIVALLQGTGLRAELRSVEKVLAGKPQDTPFASELLKEGVAPTAKLPYDCIASFHVEPDTAAAASP